MMKKYLTLLCSTGQKGINKGLRKAGMKTLGMGVIWGIISYISAPALQRSVDGSVDNIKLL